MHIFYQPEIEEQLFLSDEEAKHASRVLRLNIGDKILVYNGKGGIFTCEISSSRGKLVHISILEKKQLKRDREFWLHIAISPTKNINRFEWFLEKATEIGIDEITPILCERSERKIINNERLERILVSAIKQSKNPYLPQLNNLMPFSAFINSTKESNRFIAHCNNQNLLNLKTAYKINSDAIILIGPEGDFSLDEVNQAIKSNMQEINLGASRLRTETAGVVACHTINLLNQ